MTIDAGYFAYLLRFWRREIRGDTVLYINLENIHTGEQVRFSNLSELIAFLQEKTIRQTDGVDNTHRSNDSFHI